MTRVLFVAQQLRRRVPGGIGTYTTGLLSGIDRLQQVAQASPIDVTVYASRPPRADDPLARSWPVLRSSRLPGALLTRAWDMGVWDVPGGFGVVHCTSLAHPPARRSPLVVTIYDLAWRHQPDAFPARGRRWHEEALRRALRRAEAFVVPSQLAGGDLIDAGAPRHRVHVIGPGSDHMPPPDEPRADLLLRRLGVAAGDGQFVLSVGTLEPRKNLGRVVAAYRVARQDFAQPWPLVVVGPAGWGGSGPRSELHDEPGVIMAGAIDAGVLAALYRRARMLVYAPLAEGFGLPPLEAMAAGVPVVASSLPSTQQGGACHVDPLDVDSIAAALVRVGNDDEFRADLARQGLQLADRWKWADCARAHVELWETLA